MSSNRPQKKVNKAPGAPSGSRPSKGGPSGAPSTKKKEEGKPSASIPLEEEVTMLRSELKRVLQQVTDQQQEIETLKSSLANSSVRSSRTLPPNRQSIRQSTSLKKGNDTMAAKAGEPSNKINLEEEYTKMKERVEEMEKFFADHGLVFVGDKSPSEGIKISHVTRTFIPNFDKVFDSIDELNIMATEPQVIHTKTGATFKQCELLNLTLYRDGIELENQPFRQYSTLSVQAFFQDIEDGYYPTELKSTYPNGVIFKIVDRRNQSHAEAQGFVGKGQKLGGRDVRKTKTSGEEDDNGSSKPRGIIMCERKVDITACKINKPESTPEGKDGAEEGKDGTKEANKNRASKSQTPQKLPDLEPKSSAQSENTGEQKDEVKKAEGIKNQDLQNLTGYREDFEEIYVNEEPPVDSSLKLDQLKNDSHDRKESDQLPLKKKPKTPAKVTFPRNRNYHELNGSGSLQIVQAVPSTSEERNSKLVHDSRLARDPRVVRNTKVYNSREVRNSRNRAAHESDGARRTPEVEAISTQTSDHLVINIPHLNVRSPDNTETTNIQLAGPSRGGEDDGRPTTYNITNINYREAPVNVTVSPEANVGNEGDTCSLRGAGCAPCNRGGQSQEAPIDDKPTRRCREGKILTDRRVSACGSACSCGCQYSISVYPEPKSRKSYNHTEYSHMFGESADSMEETLKNETPPPRRSIKKGSISMTGFEHFTFLGHAYDEEDEPPKEKKGSQAKRKSAAREGPFVELNEKATDSEISIKLHYNNENYKVHIRVNDPVSKLLSILKRKGINVLEAEFLDNPSLNSEVKRRSTNAGSSSKRNSEQRKSYSSEKQNQPMMNKGGVQGKKEDIKKPDSKKKDSDSDESEADSDEEPYAEKPDISSDSD